MKSIISNERECYLCKRKDNLHKHHIFFGTANRKKSEEWGCWCYLCGPHHNLSNQGVHFNKDLDTALKKECQEVFETLHGHDKFMNIFRRNYL